ncbi:hypothetical protein A3E10_01060 [Candidatus Roizmanbacteria bacterium RIFCSPHIGHO2_12_FULL_37_23]|nr:MAG: hypothetical protein A3E10_01060 [Candidatus Roizmanbacteria bacterium RIFCSPHIGHO2_12_FULL_37_23]
MEDRYLISRVDGDNFDSFINLIKQLAIYEKLAPPDDQAIARLKTDCLSSSPRFEGFIAYIDDLPVGYMIALMTYSSFLARPTLFIEDLFILEAHRKQGIGKVLFDFAKDLAKKRECGRIDWTVLDWNEPAIKFYLKHGGTHLKD